MSDKIAAKTSTFPRLIAGVTLINAAAFAPPLAFGLLAAIRTYAPHLPEILSAATLGTSAVALALQIPIAAVALLSKRNPFAALQALFLGSIIGSLFGLGTLVMVYGGLPLLGPTAPLWLAACAGVWPCAARFLWRQLANGDPPDQERASPRRRYAVLVFALVVAAISMAVSAWFSVKARDDAATDRLSSRSASDRASKKTLEDAVSKGDAPHGSARTPSRPQDVLRQVVGEWDVVIANQRGAGRGRALAVMLLDEPWVLWRTYEGEELASIQLTGYDATAKEYRHYTMIRGLPTIASKGTWNVQSSEFVWRADFPNDVEQVMTEVVRTGSIVNHTVVYRDGKKIAEHDMRLTKRGTAGERSSADHPALKRYMGNWTFKVTVGVGESPAVQDAGRIVAVRLDSEPLVVARYYDSLNGLSEIRLLSARDDESIQLVSFTKDGYVNRLNGTWDADTSTMSWHGETTNGGKILNVEDFSVDGQFTARLEFRNAAGKKVAEGTGEYRRSPATGTEN